MLTSGQQGGLSRKYATAKLTSNGSLLLGVMFNSSVLNVRMVAVKKLVFQMTEAETQISNQKTELKVETQQLELIQTMEQLQGKVDRQQWWGFMTRQIKQHLERIQQLGGWGSTIHQSRQGIYQTTKRLGQ